MQNILLILISVALNSIAQLLLRQGMLKIGNVSFQLDQFWHLISSLVTNIYIWGGLFFFGSSVFLWLIVLSRVNVSLAYPFIGIGCVLTALLAFLFLNEPLTLAKCLGILIICIGIFILSYSKDFFSSF